MHMINTEKNLKSFIAMKNLLKLVLVFCGAIVLLSCEEELTPMELAEKNLTSAEWKLSNVKIDGVSSNLYSNLSLRFTKGSYTATNGGDIFGSSGSWAFSGTDGKKVTLGSGLSVDLLSLDPKGLTIGFMWEKTIVNTGRSSALKGSHEMVFVVQ